MFLDQGENLGDQVKNRSPKELKLLIEVPYVAHLKVKVLIFNMNLFFSPQYVPRPSYLANLKVQVVSFNMILISSQQRVFTPSYPFLGKFGR